jgi:hypothetical protein
LQEVGISWISEVQNRSETSSDELRSLKKQQTPKGPEQDSRQIVKGFSRCKLGKIDVVGRGGNVMPDSIKCMCCTKEKK